MTSSTDRAWERLAREDPYTAVLTSADYSNARHDLETRRAFFATGEQHVDWTLATIRRSVDPSFQPRRVLEFGCGVGRLLIPFAAVAPDVVGVDVSDAMLAEAGRNCGEAGVSVTLCTMERVTGTFDLVHSYTVLQHIPPRRGLAIIEELVSRVSAGGVLALQVTYARNAPWYRRTIHALRSRLPGLNGVVNLVQGARWGRPLMQMNPYPVPAVLRMLAPLNASMHLELTNHDGHLGMMIFAQRR